MFTANGMHEWCDSATHCRLIHSRLHHVRCLTLRPSDCRFGGSPCGSRVRTSTRCCSCGKASEGALSTKPEL